MTGCEPISEAELQAMQQRADAASPGPWQALIEDHDHDSGDTFIMVGVGHNRGPDMYVLRETRCASDADLDFIAAARHDIPRLIAEVRRLRGS